MYKRQPFGLAVAATRMAIDAGLLIPGDAVDLAGRIWACAEGTIRLELASLDRLPAHPHFEATLATMVRGLRPSAQLR